MHNTTTFAKGSKLGKLHREYLKAHRAEMKAVDALGDKPTRAQLDRCWALADVANKARESFSASYSAFAGTVQP